MAQAFPKQSIQNPGPKFISKPILPSQHGLSTVKADGDGDALDWGDEDDADLLAASQGQGLSLHTPKVAADPAVLDDDLNAISRLIDDEDFNIDDFDESTAADAGKQNQELRLNQTLTVFNPSSSSTQAPAKPSTSFKQPSIPAPKRNIAPEEYDKVKRLKQKAEGEATFLRGELERQATEIQNARFEKNKVEADLKQKLEEEKRLKIKDMDKMNTEKHFLVQEVNQLKEKLRQRESDKVKVAVLQRSQIDLNRVSPGNTSQFSEARKLKKPSKSVEIQTGQVVRRKCRLRRMLAPHTSLARTFSLACPSSCPETRASLLQPSSRAGLLKAVSSASALLVADVGRAPERSRAALETLHGLVSSCGSLFSLVDRTSVTETCSNLLKWTVARQDCSLLEPSLATLDAVWSNGLLTQDITQFNLSVLSTIVMNVSSFPGSLTSSLVCSFFSVLIRVSVDPHHSSLLCRPGQDCFTKVVLVLVQKSSGRSREVREAVCRGLTGWLLHCTALPHSQGWRDDSCPPCTQDAVHAVALALRGQLQPADGQAALLDRSVLVLARLQDGLRAATGCDSRWIRILEVSARVQRSYIWAVERLAETELDPALADKLQQLKMETIETDVKM